MGAVAASLSGPAQAASGFVLPVGEDLATWQSPLNLGGFVPDVLTEDEGWVELIAVGSRWLLRVHNGGDVREAWVTPPAEDGGREDIVWLARSLLADSQLLTPPEPVRAGAPPVVHVAPAVSLPPAAPRTEAPVARSPRPAVAAPPRVVSTPTPASPPPASPEPRHAGGDAVVSALDAAAPLPATQAIAARPPEVSASDAVASPPSTPVVSPQPAQAGSDVVVGAWVAAAPPGRSGAVEAPAAAGASGSDIAPSGPPVVGSAPVTEPAGGPTAATAIGAEPPATATGHDGPAPDVRPERGAAADPSALPSVADVPTSTPNRGTASARRSQAPPLVTEGARPSPGGDAPLAGPVAGPGAAPKPSAAPKPIAATAAAPKPVAVELAAVPLTVTADPTGARAAPAAVASDPTSAAQPAGASVPPAVAADPTGADIASVALGPTVDASRSASIEPTAALLSRHPVTGWLSAEAGAGLRQGTAATGAAALSGGVGIGRGFAVGGLVAVSPRTAIPALGEAPRAGGWDGALLAAWSPDRPVAPWVALGFGLSQRRFTEDGALVTSAVVPFVLAEADLRVAVLPSLSVLLGAAMTVDTRATVTRIGPDGADHALSLVGLRPGAGIQLQFGAR